jgi:hypothetical protein
MKEAEIKKIKQEMQLEFEQRNNQDEDPNIKGQTYTAEHVKKVISTIKN